MDRKKILIVEDEGSLREMLETALGRSYEVIGLKDLPVIFMTVRSEDETFVDAFGAGGNAFIAKPFEMKEMLARIREFLDGRRLVRAR